MLLAIKCKTQMSFLLLLIGIFIPFQLTVKSPPLQLLTTLTPRLWVISVRGSKTLPRIDVPNKKMVGLSTPSEFGAPLEKPMFRKASLGNFRGVEGGGD